MANVHDVAAYLRQKIAKLERLKLHKLLYYCQAWSLVWDGAPLFDQRIEAWANGPVVRALWVAQRYDHPTTADASQLTPAQCATIDAVAGFYGAFAADDLVELTHRELPWLDARGDLPEGAPSEHEITREAMAAYFASLDIAPREFPEALRQGVRDMLEMTPEEFAAFMDAEPGAPLDRALATLDGAKAS